MPILGKVLWCMTYVIALYVLSRAAINFAKAFQIIKKANLKG